MCSLGLDGWSDRLSWSYLRWPSFLQAHLMVHLICDEIDQVFLR